MGLPALFTCDSDFATSLRSEGNKSLHNGEFKVQKAPVKAGKVL